MYIYIIECLDNSLYTGIAKDIEKRLYEHFYKEKTCAKYTKSHQMTTLKALWKTDTKQNASKLEYHIKTLSRIKKQELILNPTLINSIFSNKINSSNYEYIDAEKQEIIMHKIKTKEQ